MKLQLSTKDLQRLPTDALLIPLFEKAWLSHPLVAAFSKAGLAIKDFAESASFEAKAEQVLELQAHKHIAAKRIYLLGLGAEAAYTHEKLRLAVGHAARAAQRSRQSSIAVALPEVDELPAVVRAAAEGALLGVYRYDRWRSRIANPKPPTSLKECSLHLPAGAKISPALNEALALGELVAEATNIARDLVNEPPATMTPTILAERAVAIAKEAKLKVEVHDRKAIEKLKMGMFLAVARGSVEEPRLVKLSYVPTSPAHQKRRPICIVGKAITFDSGGLSLKPSDSMIDMKIDMAGSAAMLGAMKVIAKLKPPFPVYGYFGACENMPSGNAYRLGDVITSRLGKTVEVTNTDAEGRLVLGDVLAWAAEEKPTALIDLATLTGACMVALGNFIVGAFGDDEPLVYDVLEAARTGGEDLWRLPLSPTLKEVLKSDIADMKNAGERWGGAISAGLFLKEFVGETPWVHLDIAGPASTSKERGYYSKGATGVGVRTLVELVRRRMKSAS